MNIKEQQESVENSVIALEILKGLRSLVFKDDDGREYSMSIYKALDILQKSMEILEKKSKENPLTDVVLE